MHAEPEEPTAPDDPLPPTPGLGSGGARPDWLVSAEAGLEAEASQMSIASRPAIIKPGQPRPPAGDSAAPDSPAEELGKPILFQMPKAGGDGSGAGKTPATPIAGDALATGSQGASPAGWPSTSSSAAPAGWPSAPQGAAPAGWPGPMSTPAAPARETESAPSNPFAAEFRREQEAAAGARSAAKTSRATVATASADDVPWIEPDRAGRKSAGVLPFTAKDAIATEPTRAPRPSPLAHPAAKVVGAVVLLAAVAFLGLQLMPKEGQADGTRIKEIRKSPAAFDGRVVTVSGRVGEIFQIGQSWAFYVHDGDDALLVFTRKGPPESLKKITVTGTISTGTLEGVARPSLFERAG